MTPDGVCFWTPKDGYWTGTYQEWTAGCREACELAALGVARQCGEEQLPKNGEVRVVMFTPYLGYGEVRVPLAAAVPMG